MFKLILSDNRAFDFSDSKFLVLEQTQQPSGEFVILNEQNIQTSITNFVKISQSQDAFHAIKELEGVKGVELDFVRKFEKEVLNSQIDFYISNKDQRKALEAKLNSKRAELKDYMQSQELVKEYIEQKKLVEEDLLNFKEGKLSASEAEQKKKERIKNRIEKMNSSFVPSSGIRGVVNYVTKYTWSEPIYSLAILQTIALGVIYLLSNDWRVLLIAVSALLLQIILAALAHESEFRFIQFMSRNTFDESKLIEQTIEPELDELVKYSFRKALEAEIDHLDEVIKKHLGDDSERAKNLENEAKQIESELEKLEAQTFLPEVYLQKRRELDILDMEELKEVSSNPLTILVIHENPESVSFANAQNNFLQALENINVFYIASNPKFKI